jgi:hypothetical protein
MTRNYSPSTIDVLNDIHNGALVETAALAYGLWGAKSQCNLFTVYNRIKILGLWGEVVTDITGACQLVFNWTSTVPAIGVQPISTVCSSMSAFARGRRVSFDGITVAQAVAVTASAGISYHALENITMILGVAPLAGVTSVSQIGVLSSVADATVGTVKFSLLYAGIDPGAYAEALL